MLRGSNTGTQAPAVRATRTAYETPPVNKKGAVLMTAPNGRLHTMVKAAVRAMLQVVALEGARIHGMDV